MNNPLIYKIMDIEDYSLEYLFDENSSTENSSTENLLAKLFPIYDINEIKRELDDIQELHEIKTQIQNNELPSYYLILKYSSLNGKIHDLPINEQNIKGYLKIALNTNNTPWIEYLGVNFYISSLYNIFEELLMENSIQGADYLLKYAMLYYTEHSYNNLFSKLVNNDKLDSAKYIYEKTCLNENQLYPFIQDCSEYVAIKIYIGKLFDTSYTEGLIHACKKGYKELFEKMLKLSNPCYDYIYCSYYAAEGGYTEILEQMIITCIDNMYAIAYHGSDEYDFTDAIYFRFSDILYYACKSGNIITVNKVLEYINKEICICKVMNTWITLKCIENKTYNYIRGLEGACERDSNEEIIDKMISLGAEPNIFLLEKLYENKLVDVNVVNKLILSIKNIDDRDYKQYLKCASKAGNLELIKVIGNHLSNRCYNLSNSFKVECYNAALEVACKNHNVKIVKYLLECGATNYR